MPTVLKLMAEHNRYKNVRHSLKDNIGDGYLLKKNKVYFNIRKECLKLGFKYTTKHFSGSECFPISCLDEMMRRKLLPYNNSVSWMGRVKKKSPKYDFLPTFKLFRENHIFHESAHAIALEAFAPIIRSAPKTEHYQFFLSLLQESFANTVELFSYVYSKSDCDIFFLSCNNYHYGNYLPIDIIKTKPREEFLEVYFLMMYLSFLCSNYLLEDYPNFYFDRCLSLVQKHILKKEVKLTRLELRQIKNKFDCGLTLNPNFRVISAEFYLAGNGFKKSLDFLTDFDFLSQIENHPQIGKVLNALMHVTLKD